MKQLDMTPELSAMIQRAAGKDVDPSKLVVFEAIALNTNPLPGKDGTIFERAVVWPVTLNQMNDYINAGNTIPLVADHVLFGAPMGRVFHAGVTMDESTTELRLLFYLDQTEETTIAKLNAGSLDEVSVSFLSSAFLCSECGWDYFAEGTSENIATRTCANGHEIGEDGVHADLVGLNQFLELSLVARGAADNPKVVGKSESKLAPETTYRLAAKGFEPHALVVQASVGKKDDITMDATALLTQLTTATTELGTVKADLKAVTGERDTLKTDLAARDTRISELETELATAKEAKPEDYETSKTEAAAGVAFLQDQLNHLRVAKGEAKLEGDKLPSTVADLKSQISELTGNLTSILPVDGVSQRGTGDENKDQKVDLSHFSVRKN